MKRNKIKVLSSLAILGIAGIGLAACRGNNDPTTNVATTPQVTTGGAVQTTPNGNNNTTSPVKPTQTPTQTPTPPQSSTSSSTPQKVLEEIAVSGQKVDFTVGDEFSLGNISVTKIYSDGNEEEAQASEISYEIYSGTNKVTSIIAVGTYKVVITVGGKSANYNIEVKNEQIELSETWAPTSTSGDIKEALELYNNNGNIITYNANSSKSSKYAADNGTPVLNLNGTTGVTSFDATAPRVITIVVAQAGKVEITCSSSSGTATDVRSAIFTNGTTLTETKKTPLKGDKQTFTYEVEAGTYYFYCGPSDEALGTKAGGIYIYDISIVKNVNVDDVTFKELALDTTNVTKDFNVGDTFNSDNLVVYGKLTTGESAKLSKYEICDVDMTTPGKKTITITYGTLTATYDIQVINPNATVESIVVKTNPNNLVYRQGETLLLEGLVLTATDSDSLVQDVKYDATKVSHKVLNASGEDVTANFATLSKGTYQVEVTYGGKSVTYNIVILEESGYEFKGEKTVAIGAKSYSTELIISYSDGTETDYSKYYKAVADSTDGYSVAYYSDEACTNAHATVEAAFAQEGTVYVKCVYSTYNRVIVVTCADISSQTFDVATSLTVGDDVKNTTLASGALFTLAATAGKMEVKRDDPYGTTLKFDAGSKDSKCLILTLSQKVEITLTINASGNKTYTIEDSNGTKKDYSISKDQNSHATNTLTLEAGTYYIYSTGGGLRLAGISAKTITE